MPNWAVMPLRLWNYDSLALRRQVDLMGKLAEFEIMPVEWAPFTEENESFGSDIVHKERGEYFF